MTISLQRFVSGDTNYLTKHNSNAGVLEGAVLSLEMQVQAAAGAAISEGSAFNALFGEQAAIVGKGSYVPTPDGTDLDVAAGYFWRPSTATLSKTPGTTTLAFSGVAAATYYLQVDATGAVSRSTESSEAVYSVVWTGSAFGTITRLAQIVFGAQDWLDAQDSTTLAETYESLDERFEATESLIAGAAPLASPTFTGTPAAPTAAPGTNTTQLATTAFIQAAIAALVDSSPGTLDTLNELAAALGDDANFAATLTAALADKAPLASPALTGTPTAPTAAGGTNTTQIATTAFVGAAVAAGGSVTLTGEVTGSGTGSFATTINKAITPTWTGKHIFSANAAPLPVLANTILHVGSADGVASFQVLADGFGVGAAYVLRRANTSAAAPSALQSGQALGTVQAWGYGTSAYSVASRAYLGFIASENWTDSAQGTNIDFAVTPNGSVTRAVAFTMLGSGALSIGSTGTGYGTPGQVLTSSGNAAPAWSSQPFDVHAFHPGIPTASAKVLRVPIARAVTFPANFAGSYFTATANAAATTVFDVQKNGVSIGSVSIAAGGTTATFTTSGGTSKSFAAGDVLALIAPATPDATLADPGFVFAGTR